MRGRWIKRSPYNDPQYMIWNEIIQNQVDLLQSITKIEVLNVNNTDVISGDANWIWTTVIYDRYIQFNITAALNMNRLPDARSNRLAMGDFGITLNFVIRKYHYYLHFTEFFLSRAVDMIFDNFN